jgi:hypothetical protein
MNKKPNINFQRSLYLWKVPEAWLIIKIQLVTRNHRFLTAKISFNKRKSLILSEQTKKA